MTPIERLGIEIVDAGNGFTDGMREAWERAHAAEKRCRELMNLAANILAFVEKPEAQSLYNTIDDELMNLFYEEGEEPHGEDSHCKERQCIYYGKKKASTCGCLKAPNK